MSPYHINAKCEDLVGNNGHGRYILITGSDERAKQISLHFERVNIKHHVRQHNLYLGTLISSHGAIDVAAISVGMGGASADIIINELIMLGAARILRIGTAGSLQPDRVRCGDVVIATAAVRDDKASWDYIYREYPATASFEYLLASFRAAKLCKSNGKVHFGIVHSKSSLYAREMGFSFLTENKQYNADLQKAGVLASEMECAQLYILSALMSAAKPNAPILAGGILAIIGDETPFSSNQDMVNKAIDSAITLGLETTRQLNLIDKQVAPII